MSDTITAREESNNEESNNDVIFSINGADKWMIRTTAELYSSWCFATVTMEALLEGDETLNAYHIFTAYELTGENADEFNKLDGVEFSQFDGDTFADAVTYVNEQITAPAEVTA